MQPSYFFVGLAAFLFDSLNTCPQVILLGCFRYHNIVSFLLYLLLFFLLNFRVCPANGLGLFTFFIGQLLNRIEVFLEVDFPSIFELFLGI